MQYTYHEPMQANTIDAGVILLTYIVEGRGHLGHIQI